MELTGIVIGVGIGLGIVMAYYTVCYLLEEIRIMKVSKEIVLWTLIETSLEKELDKTRNLELLRKYIEECIKSLNSGGYPPSILERIPLVGPLKDKALGVGYVGIITVRTPVVILKEPEERLREEKLPMELVEVPEELKSAVWRFVQALSPRERLEVLNIAIRVLGYPETSLSEIAEKLGYSERALYSIVQRETTRVRARKLYESLLMLYAVDKNTFVEILHIFPSGHREYSNYITDILEISDYSSA